jgi:cation transport protein ChaC
MNNDALWVFGYGSLMWRPDFSFVERQAASLFGYRRDMCFLSIHYRGTAERPGLVCGLMPQEGGVCRGVAYRIAPQEASNAIAALDARELISQIYVPCDLTIDIADGRQVRARTYVADTGHTQFVGDWANAAKAAAILAARGSQGTAYDYLASLVARLHDMKIADPHMDEIWHEVERRRATANSATDEGGKHWS